MRIEISESSERLGEVAAEFAASAIREAIAQNGHARLLLSTGASQFETLAALVGKDVDWSRVEVFHLDEYIGISIEHPASFRKYLKERFADRVSGVHMHYVDTSGDVAGTMERLTAELRRLPIDVALIGIGENAHIAFNDPPADFETTAAYIVVNLDDKCKQQQVGEGWFASLADVPSQAVSMTTYQILQSKLIISCVPHRVKAAAVQATLQNKVDNLIPATILKTHPNWNLFLDKESASLFGKF